MGRDSIHDGETQERRAKVFQQMPDATLSQATPTSGLAYTVLDTTKRVHIYSITASVTWTVQPTPLEIHITIDGQTITHLVANPISAANYVTIKSAVGDSSAANAQVLHPVATGYTVDAFPVQYEGRSVKVTAETTGGTVTNLSARVKYAVIP